MHWLSSLYLWLIHPRCVNPPLPISLLKDVGRVEGEAATAVIQRGVAKIVCKLLADLPRAGSLYPCRWCLHVEKMAAVFEAVRHTGTHQGGRHQQEG